jgi:hypothetical protein
MKHTAEGIEGTVHELAATKGPPNEAAQAGAHEQPAV